MKLLRWPYYNFIIAVSQPPAQYMSFAKNMFKADGHEACEAFIFFIITCSKGHEPVIKHCYREAAVPGQLQPLQQEFCFEKFDWYEHRDFSQVQEKKKRDYFINNFLAI